MNIKYYKGDNMSNKYNKFLTALLVILGIAGVILLAYWGYDMYRKKTSDKDAEYAVDIFQEQFVSNNINEIQNNGENIDNNYNDNNNDINNNNDETPITNNKNEGNTGSNTSNKTNNTSYNKSNTKYAGYTMIGTIEIPKIKLKSPILQELTTKSLQKATILIYGNLNKQENAVIIGHNNRNGTFFSNLKKLSNGDKITITDDTGTRVTYTVYSKFQASPDDTSFYQRDTNGLSEITLSTCTDNDDAHRIIILARES